MAPDPPPGGYSAGGVRPTWQQEQPGVVTPEWARERARHRPAEPPPAPPGLPPAPQPADPAPSTEPERASRRRYELPVVLVLVLGILAAMAALTIRAGSTPDDFPHNAATALWPTDGAARDITFTTGSISEPGVIDHARLRGFESLAGVPAPWAPMFHRPDGDPATAHFWRQTSTRFNELDRRIQMRQATTGGTMLYGQTWGDRGISYGPPIREVPHDVSAGATWESHGDAALRIGGRQVEPYTNTSSAGTPSDAAEAERGCLLITSETRTERLQLDEESLWCPGEGIVRQSGTWNSLRYEFTPADPAPVSDQARASVPLPDATAGDPAGWETGWIDAPMETDTTFGTEAAVLIPLGAPVVGDTGYAHVASQVNGDVLTIMPSLEDGPDYSAGTGLLIHRAHAGGQVTSVGTHGQMFTATTSERTLTMFGGNGARRWTVELSEVAMAAPISLGPDRVAVATLDGRVRMLDAATGQEIWNTRASRQGIAQPLATDGTTIGALDADSTLLLLDAATGELLSDDTDFGQPVADLVLTEGVAVLTAGQVAGFDARTGDRLWESVLSVPDRVVADGDRVLAGTPNRMRILDAQTGATITDRPIVPTAVLAIDGGFLVLADGEVQLWGPDGQQRHTWSLDGLPADTLDAGDGRVWALDSSTMTGWWVQP
ncbi:MAG: PQQ-binding-like beta-propeller repeat protein [Propionibacterium sp.]|nr:PQQ-binding-like beta-propeller repeat protein [Propionibacterium sp.]